VDWFRAALDRDVWWAVVYTVMNILLSHSGENFLTSRGPISLP
jgi:hypothetical protein